MPFDRAPSRVEGPNEVGACAPRTRVDPRVGEQERARTHGRAPMAATDSPGEMSVADEQMPTGEQSASFRFEARRARLDWRLLHSVDVDRLMRENDLDMLETTLVRIVTLLPAPVTPPEGWMLKIFDRDFPPNNDPPSPSPSPPTSTGDRGVRRRHRRGQPQPHRQQQPQDPPTRAVPSRIPPPRPRNTRVAQRTTPTSRRGCAARMHRRQVPVQARTRTHQDAQARATNREEGAEDLRSARADSIGQTA